MTEVIEIPVNAEWSLVTLEEIKAAVPKKYWDDLDYTDPTFMAVFNKDGKRHTIFYTPDDVVTILNHQTGSENRCLH